MKVISGDPAVPPGPESGQAPPDHLERHAAAQRGQVGHNKLSLAFRLHSR
jgi:hypothetical protein